MKSYKLKNGTNLIIKNVPGAKSFTCMILVGAGSRYENKDNRGISHFLEHMFFKGAKKYKNAKEVSTAIDSIGGDFNAFTGKEYAGYYVKCASRSAEVAFDVLSDMLTYPTFDPEEIDKERGVILEELNMYLDMPKYQVAWEFEELIIGDQALGWDQLGTRKLIKTITQEDFNNYRKALYTPDNLIITLTGDIGHEKGAELSEKYFGKLSGEKSFAWQELEKNKDTKRIKIINKKTEQSHIVVGLRGSPGKDLKNYWTQKVLAALLGGMMSSRMFLNIREAKGLCYYINTNTDDYTDFGIVSTSAGVNNDKVDSAIEAILKEYKIIASTKVSKAEVEKAKNFLIGKTLLSLEDTENLAHMYGKQQLLLGKTISENEIVKNIEKVQIEDISNLTQEIFKKGDIYITGIGPLEGKEKIWEGYLNNY